jgi:hypothetical protein
MNIKVSWILIPFIIIIALLLVVLVYTNPNGTAVNILSNIITDLAVIVLSITYIKWALDREEKEKWKKVSHFLTDRLELLIDIYCRSMRVGFGFSFETLKAQKGFTSGDPKLMREAAMEFTKNYVLAQFDVRSGGQLEWEPLIADLNMAKNQLDDILIKFNSIIAPEIYSKLLELDKTISKVKKLYYTFPELLNEEMPEGEQFTYQIQIQDSITSDLKKTLEIMLELNDELPSL